MMIKKVKYTLIASVFIVSMVLSIDANSETPQAEITSADGATKPMNQPEKQTGDSRKPGLYPLIYIPPKPEKAAPYIRVSTGGTRGSNTDFPVVTLLVPEHLGITYQAQPTLSWHLSESTDRMAVITVIDPDQVDPLLELTQNAPVVAGIHAVSLSDHGKSLNPGIVYEWSVSLLVNADQPSSDDLVARGLIEMRKPTVEFMQRISQASALERAGLYARHGIWYDALSALSDKESDSRRERKRLLEQVGLAQCDHVVDARLAASVINRC